MAWSAWLRLEKRCTAATATEGFESMGRQCAWQGCSGFFETKGLREPDCIYRHFFYFFCKIRYIHKKIFLFWEYSKKEIKRIFLFLGIFKKRGKKNISFLGIFEKEIKRIFLFLEYSKKEIFIKKRICFFKFSLPLQQPSI